MRPFSKFHYLLVCALLIGIHQSSLATSQLAYSTFLSGSTTETEGMAIAVDLQGNMYVVGYFTDAPFPTTGTGYDTTFGGGHQDLFVCKINPALSGTSSLVYSTYLGGNASEDGNGITVDTAGNIYLVGNTSSTDFPITGNSYQTTNIGKSVFLTKLNPSLSGTSSLIYSTYLGTQGYQYGTGLALDNSGNIFITGFTNSTEFPVTSNAYDSVFHGGEDTFVCKFDINLSDSSSLLYSTLLGGGSNDEANGIGVTPSGKVWITGFTRSSTDFPVTSNAVNTTFHQIQDIFVSEIDPAIPGNSGLIYSTVLGGNYNGTYDTGLAIAVDSLGNAYVTGITHDYAFPTTPNAFDTTNPPSGYHVFIVKIDSSFSGSSSLVYSTYLKGSNGDAGRGIALDRDGNVYVTGYTFSSNFPTTDDAIQSTNLGSDAAFITKLNLSLSGASSLIYSTYLGGPNFDGGNGIAVDTAGNVYITGFSYSSTFPTTPNAFDTTYHGIENAGWNAFVSQITLSPPVPVLDWMMYASQENKKNIKK